jgi:lipopolysaccharide export system protein LptC
MASTASPARLRLTPRLQAALPATLLGLLALLTYWLVQNSPIIADTETSARASVKPNAYFHDFRLVGFGPQGQTELQLTGVRAVHHADTDRYDIEQPRMVRTDEKTGVKTWVSAQRGQINDTGKQLELFGQASVQRQATLGAGRGGTAKPPMDIRSEYLLLDDNRQLLQTHLPVTIIQGQDQFSAQRMTALQRDGRVQLDGRVRGTLAARQTAPAKSNQ